MEYITVGTKNNPGKIAKIYCNLSEDFKNISNRNKAFVLFFVYKGEGTIKHIDNLEKFAAPCFICTDEKYNIKILSPNGIKAHSLYFSPEFLNVNMKLELLRSNEYHELADIHSFFQLSPFINNELVIPILSSYVDLINTLYLQIAHQMTEQPDWYWSCRGRSYFMEIIQKLEQLYDLKHKGMLHTADGTNFISDFDSVKQAIIYITANYTEQIRLEDLARKCNSNRTSLTNNFKSKIGMTVNEYIIKYRVDMAADKLRFTELAIKEIASQCGFKSSAHFCRTFKGMMDMNPQQFRDKEVSNRITEFKPSYSY